MTRWLILVTLLSPSASALADELYSLPPNTLACEDRGTVATIGGATESQRNDSDWMKAEASYGRCSYVHPWQKWEVVTKSGGSALVRIVPPRAGSAPVWVLEQNLQSLRRRESVSNFPAGEMASSPSQSETAQVVPQGGSAGRPYPSAPAEGGDGLVNSAPKPDADPPPDAPSFAPADTSSPPYSVISIIIFITLAFFILKAFIKKRLRGKAAEIAFQEIDRMAEKLHVAFLQKTIPDHYGTIDLTAWMKEVNYFCRTRIITILNDEGLARFWPDISSSVLERINDVAKMSPMGATIHRPQSDPRIFSPTMTPTDYELHCALLLQQDGWDARTTKGSGDQGSDVIAMRNGKKIVLQCKLYSRPVGNSAVQEAIGARGHERANAALVVSNAPYTQSAKSLAQTNGIFLLHHSELAAFSQRI